MRISGSQQEWLLPTHRFRVSTRGDVQPKDGAVGVESEGDVIAGMML